MSLLIKQSMETAIKTCFKCKTDLPLEAFHRHSQMKDGHLNKCKACVCAYARQRRQENPKVQAYDRERGNRQSPEYLREYRQRYPNKYKAHTQVNNLVRLGKLCNPGVCSECSSDFHIEAHHDDYSQPLQIRWLCSRCHKQWHAEHGEALNA